MSNIIIAGIGTDAGKTIVSAILTSALSGDYWKPIQCGDEENSDTAIVKSLISSKSHRIHEPVYSFKNPVSPHQAAKNENCFIDVQKINLPATLKPLIIEGVGGIFVPLTDCFLSIDLFSKWNAKWVIVSRHYLGSINHTLLTLEALKSRNIEIGGIIFNGYENKETESAILNISKVNFLGRLLPERQINKSTIQKYTKEWKQCQLIKNL
jgi:dethiobiotin synthetase